MISWIQKYFQKHFRIVFAAVLVAMAVPLIVIYSQSSGLGQGGHRTLQQSFFGHNLGNEADARQVMRDGNFSAQLRGAYQANPDQIQQYALTRVAGLSLADQLHLPVPTEKEVSAFVATLPAFRDQQGNFDQKRYAQFGDSLKNNPQFTIADANRVFRDDARLDSLSKLVGGPGYVLPADVAKQLERGDAIWSVDVATIDYASFDSGATVTDAALQKFFEENAFRYEVPARPKISLIEFNAADYAPPVAPTEEQLRAFYNANIARFPVPADAEKKEDKKDAGPADNFPKVRAQVEAAIRQEAAVRGAVKAANDFTVALYESKAAPNSPELAAFLAAKKHPAVAIAPFAPDTPPADKPWLGYYAEQISRLSKERFFSDPLPTPNSAVILLWNDTVAAYKPMLNEVRDKVAADYKESEKRKRFVEQGKVVRGKLEAAVKAGTPFEKAAAAEKLEVKSYANFTLRQPPQDFPYSAFSTLQDLKAGEVADMVATNDKGYFVFAAQKKLPDLSEANPRFAQVRDQLRQMNASGNEGAILGAMVEAELKKSAPADRTAR
ncbi:MAG TPA: peptidyl-prolyl cis-trans isomerase [Candidatus Didemnitutus sp.]|nr:peptidyl-prolyl cis-trans isomerase [Candidatus Didemnitutus sp.]